MTDPAAALSESIKDAMRSKDTARLAVLRSLKTAVMNVAVDKGGPNTPLEPAEFLAVVRRQIKQRQDSLEQFQAAGRSELAAKEAAEMTILAEYLPAPLSPEDLAAIVDQAIADTGAATKADMGKVMTLLQQRTDGRADGRTLSQALLARLA